MDTLLEDDRGKLAIEVDKRCFFKGFTGLPPAEISPEVKKKTFTLGESKSLQVKVLLLVVCHLSQGPGVSTVLTGRGSAISPADSYSPLHVVDNRYWLLTCQ